MKSVLIIGMGRFGHYLALKFLELGNEVMIVDKNEEQMSDLISVATNAQIGDCTKEEVLRSLGVRNFDVCFVCVGSDFQNSLEITAMLKDLGAKYVVSKATREIQAKFLLRNGADEVTYPERDMAEKVAVRHSTNHLFDYFELTKEVSIYEIPVHVDWVGRSIREVNFRVKYHASILAVKVGDQVSPMPPADHVFNEEEHLLIMARYVDLERILKKLN